MKPNAWGWLLITAVMYGGCGNASQPARTGSTSATATHHARGVIVGFGEGRAFVRIKHEDIPGYMRAMTMPFEPAANISLANFAIGDVVEFGFDESEEGRRIIVTMEKKP
jgi:Cu(I)/Ag(I) efflux system periplasmic protein CusF